MQSSYAQLLIKIQISKVRWELASSRSSRPMYLSFWNFKVVGGSAIFRWQQEKTIPEIPNFGFEAKFTEKSQTENDQPI